jgi:hypothetical protein
MSVPKLTLSKILCLIVFFNLPNPSSRTMALGSTQSLTEMSTRNLLGGVKSGLPASKADNLTAICEPVSTLRCVPLSVHV